MESGRLGNRGQMCPEGDVPAGTERARRVREEARRLGIRLPSTSPFKLMPAVPRDASKGRK